MNALRRWLSLVRFSHSIFALPFALQGAWLAARGTPPLMTLVLIVFCAVSARTAAMAFNRLVDREIDGRNPRTRGRELPAGLLRPRAVLLLTVASAAGFIGGAFALSHLAGWLSLPVLVVLLGYSLVKRFSAAAHLVLGLALGLAPLGAWLAVRGDLSGDLVPVLLLALAVLCWVAGFDLIYACQDAEFDRKEGLFSIPARYGKARALLLSRALHGLTLLSLVGVAWRADLGTIYWIALLATALLLAFEQSIVSADDLSRVDLAFFTLNGWVGVALYLGLVLDLGLAPGGASLS